MSLSEVSTELKKVGEVLSVSGIKKVLTRSEVKDIIDREKSRLTNLIPEAITNFEYWVRNAKMFDDKTDREIGYRTTLKVLESHALVSGAPSESIKVTINQSEVILSPVIEKMLAGFMGKLSEAKPIEPTTIDVEYEILPEEIDEVKGAN